LVKSMTGFGRGLAENEDYSITVEAKSVNHRFCELYVRLPKPLNCFDDMVKKIFSSRVDRGKFDIFIDFERRGAKNPQLNVDKELAIAYYKAMLEIAEACDLPLEVKVNNLTSLPGVFSLETPEEDRESIGELLPLAVNSALDALLEMRSVEGKALTEDLLAHLALVNGALEQIKTQSETVVAEQKQRLEQRLTLLLGEIEVDQYKLANELAFFADKVDINEEVTRLKSHIEQFKQTLQTAVPIGRKLDFILQEMMREINTIGSKSNNLFINKLVIDSKNEMERIKEQIQNIE